MNTKTNLEAWRYTDAETDAKAVLQDMMSTYGNDVWNYAFTLLRNADLADDITQDVFLKVYRNLSTFRGESSVKTWLLAITRNCVYDYKRSALFRHFITDRFTHIRTEHRSAESEALEHIAVNDIWKQVLTLPVKYREVLILFGHHQLSIKEIAAMLGVSEGTVKSRLHHARKRILERKEGS